MKRIPILLLCAVMFPPVFGEAVLDKPLTGAPAVSVVKSLEFQSLDGPVRLRDDRVVFSHLDQSGNAHNAVLLDPADGSFQNAVAGVAGARFIAADERYLVFSSRGTEADSLVLMDKRSGAQAASVSLRQNIQWGHIHKDRLITVQGGGAYNIKVAAQVYALPSLKPQKSAEIFGGNDTAVWGNKIVSIGSRLGIYSLDLREIALLDMPPRDAGIGGTCIAGPLRIFGDKAVVAANCGQLVVVDLPSARVERVIRADSASQFFDISDGLIFTVSPDGKEREVRVIELASGVELARLPVDADFVVARGNRLLGMKKGARFLAPVQFTLYELDLASIKSETSRVARVKDACGRAERSLDQGGDIYSAIEACEVSGIKGFTDSAQLNPELVNVIASYAIWLTRTLSRYNEGSALLERLHSQQPNDAWSAELAAGRQKARYLDPPSKGAPSSKGAEPPGVLSVPVDIWSYSDPVYIKDDRIYVARWFCKGKQTGDPGVVLEVLDRKTFQTVKRIDIALCDNAQYDYISIIAEVPGYIVLGLTYKLQQQYRPNVAVVDAQSLELIAKGDLDDDIAQLRRWQGKLLACATPGRPSHRFDPKSAQLVAATAAETKACVKGTVILRKSSISTNLEQMILAETASFRVHRLAASPEFPYKITRLKDGSTSPAKVEPRLYFEVLPVAERDALVLGFSNDPFRRFVLLDLTTGTENMLFELNPAGRPVAVEVWRKFLFVSLGRDLLVYDLAKHITVKYEKDLIGGISEAEQKGVKALFVDRDRLIASTDGASARIIDLNVYLKNLPKNDFFMAQSR